MKTECFVQDDVSSFEVGWMDWGLGVSVREEAAVYLASPWRLGLDVNAVEPCQLLKRVFGIMDRCFASQNANPK